jgi:hypothetical protein
LKCANHLNKIVQLESDSKPIPDPIYSVNKSVNLGQKTSTAVLGDFPQPIYMEVTEVDGSPTVQVVVDPGDLEHQHGELNQEQLFQSAVLLASNDDYQEFVVN